MKTNLTCANESCSSHQECLPPLYFLEFLQLHSRTFCLERKEFLQANLETYPPIQEYYHDYPIQIDSELPAYLEIVVLVMEYINSCLHMMILKFLEKDNQFSLLRPRENSQIPIDLP